MGFKNREIEKKFTVPGVTYKQSVSIIKKMLSGIKEINGVSMDYYWNAPKGVKADFLRLRYMPEDTGQLTVKYSDRKTTLDRVEVDVTVTETSQAHEFLTQLFGPAQGRIYKSYWVLIMDEKDTTVSVYQIKDDPRVFVEIEARSVSKVDRIEQKIRKTLNLERELRSLYKVFLSKEK
jgi:hypothetical protein